MTDSVTYVLQRMDSQKDSSYGVLYDEEGKHQCFIIEDEHRLEKVDGETRIPAGKYQVKFREVLSPLTKRYRNRFDWFTYHLELQDVPNFEYIYIHAGNTEEQTEGCLLPNTGVSRNGAGEWYGLSSVQAFETLYQNISKHLSNGVEVHIAVRNEDYLSKPF